MHLTFSTFLTENLFFSAGMLINYSNYQYNRYRKFIEFNENSGVQYFDDEN